MSVKSGYSYFNATVGLLMLLTHERQLHAGKPMSAIANAVGLRRRCLAAAWPLGGCKSSGGAPADGGDDGHGANCPAADDLISDFESDNSLAPVGGRQGGWYTYGDDVGIVRQRRQRLQHRRRGNPNCSPMGSLHVKGTGFAMWGAATGVDWKPRPADGDGGYGDKMTYDASAYRGIAFWAKASAPLDGVQVSFPDLYTDNAAPPHDMPDPAEPRDARVHGLPLHLQRRAPRYNCSPYLVQFGKKGDAAADVVFSGYSSYQLDTTWKRFQVLFVDTKQDPGNGGYHTPADRLTRRQADRDGDPDQRRLLDRLAAGARLRDLARRRHFHQVNRRLSSSVGSLPGRRGWISCRHDKPNGGSKNRNFGCGGRRWGSLFAAARADAQLGGLMDKAKGAATSAGPRKRPRRRSTPSCWPRGGRTSAASRPTAIS